MSGLREYMAEVSVGLPVSRLAKWKTAVQMMAIGFLLVGGAGPAWLPVEAIGWCGLWIAAVLTLVTGWDYLQAGLRHMLRTSRSRPAARSASVPETVSRWISPCGSAISPGSSIGRLRRRDAGAAAPRSRPSATLKLWLARAPPRLRRGAGEPGRGALRGQPGVRAGGRAAAPPATRWRSSRRSPAAEMAVASRPSRFDVGAELAGFRPRPHRHRRGGELRRPGARRACAGHAGRPP